MLCGEASGEVGERDCRSLLSWQSSSAGKILTLASKRPAPLHVTSLF